MSGNWGNQLLEFWETNVVWYRILASPQSWVWFVIFLISKVWTAGRPLQHHDRWSVPFSTVMMKNARYGWEHMLLQNLYIPFMIDGAFPDARAANFIGADALLYYQRCRLFNWILNLSDHRTVFTLPLSILNGLWSTEESSGLDRVHTWLILCTMEL